MIVCDIRLTSRQIKRKVWTPVNINLYRKIGVPLFIMKKRITMV